MKTKEIMFYERSVFRIQEMGSRNVKKPKIAKMRTDTNRNLSGQSPLSFHSVSFGNKSVLHFVQASSKTETQRKGQTGGLRRQGARDG